MTFGSRRAIRLLSVVVVVLLAVVPARLGSLWSGLTALAMAEEPPSPNAAGADDQSVTAPDVAAASADGDATAQPDSAPSSQINSITEVEFDPLTLTKAEIDTLRTLAKRRDEITARERALQDREVLLSAAEQRIAAQVQQLKALKAEIDAKAAKGAVAETSPLQRLVVVYEAMKPEDAARIFEVMDSSVLVEVADHMAERRLAPVLAQMNANKAQALTVALANRHSQKAVQP